MPSAPAIPPICEPDTTSGSRALRKPQNARHREHLRLQRPFRGSYRAQLGGDAAVNLVARKLDAPIDLLISLDPVSRKGAPRRKIPNVRHWLNIHIDYSQSTWLDIPNLVARIGGPWEAAENADVNVSCPPDMTHAWAWGMFERYGEKVLRERAEGWK